MITKEKAIDIVEKFAFFQGQIAGRELWFSKPRWVQEEDVENFQRDCCDLLEFLREGCA
jgi:hypothetical protein